MSKTTQNHLGNEKSPYLLQHAQNPVDWYPWGPEAFEKARKEDKPILISIGYSTCHWCHVMEHESFEDPAVAGLMNKYLVAIKVDREERPDIDKLYMTAVSAMTGQGGWPLNAFATPDLKPFFGGTYFPPEPKWGHPSWKDLVTHIGKSWKDPKERQRMLDAGEQIVDSLKRYAGSSGGTGTIDASLLEGGYRTLADAFDSTRGGFSPAPKFPMPVFQHFLFRYWARTRKKEALEMALSTLRAMAHGGLYDQLGGGFARYSTDVHWHVPHFEKMLYDNAQLALNYLEAYQISRDDEWKRLARETLDYVARDMTSPEGAFYSAEDADSFPDVTSPHKKEGAFYVWEKEEIAAILGTELADLFNFRFGVRAEGNARQDPHDEFKNKNILYQAHPIAETARHFKLSEPETLQRLEDAKRRLLEVRKKRPRPHLDDKIISAWNGLMISAYAKAAHILGGPEDLARAQKAATFIIDRLYDKDKGLLYRRWREGHRQGFGIADDYAFLIQGLLDLYEADFNPYWVKVAEELNKALIRRFYDTAQGGFFMTATDQDEKLLIRFKEDQDNVEPSAGSIEVLNLLRMAQLTGTKQYEEIAEKTLASVAGTLRDSPRSFPAMLTALDYASTPARQIVIAGAPASPDTQALLKVVKDRFIPVKVLVLNHEGKTLTPFAPMRPVEGKATAYVCEHFTCQKPTTDPIELAKQLDRRVPSN